MKCGVFGLRAQAYLERRYNVWGLDKCRLEWLSIWQELPERVPRIVPAQAFSASYTRHPLEFSHHPDYHFPNSVLPPRYKPRARP